MATLVIHADTSVWCSSLQIAEEESLATTHRGTVLNTSTQREGELTILRYVDIQVGTIVETIVFEGLILVVREGLEERVLIQESGRNEVSYFLSTAVHIHIYLLLPCGIVHHIFNPVGIGECNRHVTCAEMLHHILTESDTCVGIRRVVFDIGSTRPLTHRKCIGNGCVVPHLSISIGISEIDELRDLLNCRTCRNGYGSLAWSTTLGGNKDNTISTTYTEYGCSRGILQDRDVLDFIGIELSKRTLNTIHKYQRFSTVQRTCTTNADNRFVSTWHT